MKLLLDQNLSSKLCARLDPLYPGTSQARLLGLDQAPDARLWIIVRDIVEDPEATLEKSSEIESDLEP